MMARASSVAQPKKISTDRSEGLPLGKVSFIDKGRDSLSETGSMLVMDDSRRVEQAGVLSASQSPAPDTGSLPVMLKDSLIDWPTQRFRSSGFIRRTFACSINLRGQSGASAGPGVSAPHLPR